MILICNQIVYLVTAECMNIVSQHYKSNVKLLILNSLKEGVYKYEGTDNLLLKDLFYVYKNIQIVYISFLEENKIDISFQH